MLGDVAVAVNPDDERYKALHGKLVRLPVSVAWMAARSAEREDSDSRATTGPSLSLAPAR